MKSKSLRLLLVFCFLQSACKQKDKKQNTFDFNPPKVVEAKIDSLPRTVSPPQVVTVTNLKKRKAGRPEIVDIKTNIFPAKITTTIPVSIFEVVKQSGTGYLPPKVVPAIDSPYPALSPEVITLESHQIRGDKFGNFSEITAVQGLNSDEISSLMQDKNANLWIGTWYGGLSRYDGRFLYNYSIHQGLCSDVVNCIVEDESGNIWIGTYDNGVNKFDGKYFTRYSIKEGLADSSVNNILQDKAGNMWFATNNGLSKFDGRFFTQFGTDQGLPTNRIRSLMEDSHGNLWVGTYGGLTRFDGRRFLNYTTALNFDNDTEVSGILEDDNKNIWFGTNKGLFKYDGRSISQFTANGGLSSNAIMKIMKEKNGDIWIGTRGGGANRFDGKSFVHLGIEEGLANENVPSILQDKWNNIWLATTAGLCKYEGKLFNHVFPVRQGEIECVLADKRGNIWMGSGTGQCVNKYDGKRMFRYTSDQGLASTSVNQMLEDRHGNIWFAARGGIDKYDGTNFTHYSMENGLVDNVVFCITEDKKGNLWFGTNKGLSKFDGKSFTNYLNDQGLCGETIFAVSTDHLGNIWIGTAENGVCKFDGSSFTHYSKNNSLSDPTVVGMTEDKDNNMWFCTGMGVNKFDGKYFTWYTTEQGLSDDIAKNVVQDRSGNIWVGTINGLNRFVPHAPSAGNVKNTVPSYFKNYTLTEGFSGGGTYDHSIAIDKRGYLWIGANDRLSLYHPEHDLPDTIAPIIHLTEVSIFGERIGWRKILDHIDSTFMLKNNVSLKNVNFSGLAPWYNQPENLHLQYDNNYLTFQFIGITTNRPKEIRYSYKLEGFDKNWISTDLPSAVYNNLPHGRYSFKVKSANGEGYWSSELKYYFVIFPPWWKTKLAYWLYAVTFAGMIWMFSRYRSKKLRADNIRLEEKVKRKTNELEQSLEERYKLSEQIKSQQALLNERLRISRELHDDIGSTLGSISIYSEVAKTRTLKNENTTTVLSKIGSASRELIDKMSDIVWSLNLNNDNFTQMEHRMMVFAQMMLAPRNIEYQFNVDEESKNTQLTGTQAKNIFIIYKEALYNMVKYAGCNRALVCFQTDKNQLIMVIRDNGKGFHQLSEVESSSTEYIGGNGIKNMYARASEIQAILNITSAINEGTTITLTIPV